MKRLIGLCLAMVLLFSFASASEYSSLSDADLRAQFDAIRNELMERGLIAAKNTVLFDQEGIKIYINDAPYVEESMFMGKQLIIPVIIVNDSEQSIDIIATDSSVNGWTTDAYISGEVPKGKKAKSQFKFELEDTDVSTMEDFVDAEFSLRVYDGTAWKEITTTAEPIVVYASK